MPAGYLIASPLVGWLAYMFASVEVPVWGAFTLAILPTCLVLFVGLVRDELPTKGSQSDWLRAGAVERRMKQRD